MKNAKRAESVRTVCGAMLLALTAVGCGIYTVNDALNRPFGISVSALDLKFSGYNGFGEHEDERVPEVLFLGYTLWYKESAGDIYRPIQYKSRYSVPTVPFIDDLGTPQWPSDWVATQDFRLDSNNPRVEYTILIDDMIHPIKGYSFNDAQLASQSFYFAVSASGTDGRESEKVEFGRWPL